MKKKTKIILSIIIPFNMLTYWIISEQPYTTKDKYVNDVNTTLQEQKQLQLKIDEIKIEISEVK